MRQTVREDGNMKAVKDLFSRNYFSKEFPLEYRIYMIFFFEFLLISLLSATTNTLLEKGALGVTLQWIVNALCIAVLIIPVKVRMAIQKPLLIFVSFVYIPFLYFQTAGYDGTALLFAPLAIFLLAIIFKGRRRVVIIALNILVFIGCCLVEYFNPGIIVPHATAADKLIDLVVALTLSTSGLAIMAVYISNAFKEERDHIKALMNEDALTGAYARRYLFKQLPREIAIAQRSGKPLSILMFDLDYFKRINDTYGHSFGDEILQAVARAVSVKLRPYDIFSRYGGEEFIVVLPGTSFDEAFGIAERLRQAVESLDCGNGVKVSISLGAAEYRYDESHEMFIERVDQYLYEAKNTGRNRASGRP